jgi:hypothetical protein
MNYARTNLVRYPLATTGAGDEELNFAIHVDFVKTGPTFD